MSNLRGLGLTGNGLFGGLPKNIDRGLPALEELAIASNYFNGEIPESIANCSKLRLLELGSNNFTGLVPHSLGTLRLLERLGLFNNNLSSSSSELSFITSLTNCRSLYELAITDNPIDGILPTSVGNLSKSLQIFHAYNCELKGTIPPEIGNLSNLVTLALGGNELSGEIPIGIKNMHMLQGLSLDYNKMSGSVFPEVLCDLDSLVYLYLNQNNFSGTIPDCLGNVTSLRNLYLDSNMLTSTIPSSVWRLADLLKLNLSSNLLSGFIPPEIGNLVTATVIDMSVNRFSESIPSAIGKLTSVTYLSLAHNGLEGSIPETVGSMVSLVTVDLSYNNLSGSIPKSLESLQSLHYFNVSFNALVGEIPTDGPFRNFTIDSFMANDALCGVPRFYVPPCGNVSEHRSKMKRVRSALFIVIGIVAFISFLSLAFIFVRYKRKYKANAGNGVDGVVSTLPERISYYELLQATEQFSETNLLGTGSFGSVYKGVLRDGKVLAVKVFNSLSEVASKSFDVECEVLRNIRHRNLTKVVSSCSNEEFKALVLEYMPNGNLDKWLYSHNYCLDLLQRLNIMIDVACALEYLHHGYSSPIVHCDLKPSNVLLDEEMVAHVSDFGIAKLLGDGESIVHTNTLATLGYIAPEYGLEGLVSTRCDVYSYGVMVMETFTRKRPSDDMFAEGLSLKSWVQSSLWQSPNEVIDSNLLNTENEQHFEKNLQCVSSILELALKCLSESPGDRITMKEALAELQKIKGRFSPVIRR
ncbi:PREDICTED: LRR receptor-like serine/threonine-protein kinase EFR [Erythranthe guttata]|uniref:LRR receptor-like serine/threonine-protein kinase EFR n=1 Tax=Erythranthe guttata TaxID=4155 RepID=UPI00064D9179|nr:PREDICTED: LRR receptor-like serine/threonine-protein kinase EFR [Erythranthe guttata]|eukprot:XP_012833553.1 PREDICTED: LRR receptor-like serine/threonine-protein kinase EFR [Erythranthe guttata]